MHTSVQIYNKNQWRDRNEDIVNMFLFTLRDIIFKWGQNSLGEHPNCIFIELE
jgi:hypothetical protein